MPLLPITHREGFEGQLKPVLPLAYRVAVILLGDRDSAMDLVQEASVIAFRAFYQFETGTNFKAWFLRILTNKYFRMQRVNARFAHINLEEAPELFLYLSAKRLGIPMEGDPAGFILNQVDSEMILNALARLPEEYRMVASLHFISDLSYQDCADALGIAIGTVRSRLHRARRLLQVALWQIAEERGYVSSKGTV